MARTVYMLGAGINRGIVSGDGLRPPLALDFFAQRVRSASKRDPYFPPIEAYLKRYWRFDASHPERSAVDLEAVYSMIALQLEDARRADNEAEVRDLSQLHFRLTRLLADYFDRFRTDLYMCDEFRRFGEIVYRSSATVLTFNYDLYLEYAIEIASGHGDIGPVRQLLRESADGGEVPDELMAFSFHEWNMARGYGYRFDEVTLPMPGVSRRVSGARFYEKYPPYDTPILKLHGSVNWLERTGQSVLPAEYVTTRGKPGDTLFLTSGTWFDDLPTDEGGEILLPVIVTPVPHKRFDSKLLRSLWHSAKEALRECDELVVGGYSFPPTDFHVRRLLLEAFADGPPKRLTVINPDTSVVRVVKELCRYELPVTVCRDLAEYVLLYGDYERWGASWRVVAARGPLDATQGEDAG